MFLTTQYILVYYIKFLNVIIGPKLHLLTYYWY